MRLVGYSHECVLVNICMCCNFSTDRNGSTLLQIQTIFEQVEVYFPALPNFEIQILCHDMILCNPVFLPIYILNLILAIRSNLVPLWTLNIGKAESLRITLHRSQKDWNAESMQKHFISRFFREFEGIYFSIALQLQVGYYGLANSTNRWQYFHTPSSFHMGDVWIVDSLIPIARKISKTGRYGTTVLASVSLIISILTTRTISNKIVLN